MNCIIVEEIIQLRKQNLSMGVIADKLNITRETVRYHCRKNGLSGILAANIKVERALEIFLANIEKNHSNQIEYVSGFINTEKPVLIRCKRCKHEFNRSAQFARKKKSVRCFNCEAIEREMRIRLKNSTVKIVDPIKLLRKRILKEAIKPKTVLKEVHILKCIECSSVFGSERKRSICSQSCINRRNNRIKELRKRKARTNGKVDYSITIEKVIHKEKNVCYLCGGQCDSTDFTIDDRGSFIVGKNYPSIEHVVAISKGGTHTWDNVKLAHHYCNSIKNDKKIVEDTGQMVLML